MDPVGAMNLLIPIGQPFIKLLVVKKIPGESLDLLKFNDSMAILKETFSVVNSLI